MSPSKYKPPPLQTSNAKKPRLHRPVKYYKVLRGLLLGKLASNTK